MRFAVRVSAAMVCLLSACDAGGRGARMQVDKTCRVSKCDLEQEQCQQKLDRFCYQCQAECPQHGTCTECIETCTEHDCSLCTESGCAEAEYEVLMPTPDRKVGNACREYFDHVRSCGTRVPGDPCDTFELTERRAVASTYRCLAAAPCGEETNECELPEPTGLADEVCDALADACGTAFCDREVYDWLEDSDGWLRPGVRDAVHVCYSELDCEERVECISTWMEALQP